MNINSFKELVVIIKKNKKMAIIIVILLVSIIYLATFASPKIDVIVQIQSVTDKDYDIFVDINDSIPLEKKTRDNCRFISVAIKTVKPIFLVRNFKIKYIGLSTYLLETSYFNKFTNKVEFLGQYTSSGNNTYAEGIDVYMDGMTDEKLKDFFKDYRIEFTWDNLLTGKGKKVFYLYDLFENYPASEN
ncbi:MAG: hypothetical protein ACYDEX_01665 [Mobilitalea sp.]